MKTKGKILLTCLLGCVFLSMVNAESPSDPGEAVHQRIIAKVERAKEGMQAWAASGRDPSAIVKTLQETIKPLLAAGKVLEAEAELDRLLEQLKPAAKSPGGGQPIPDQHGVRAGTTIYRDVNYAGTSDANQTMDIFVPPGASATNKKAVIVCIHGGGWGWDRKADKAGVHSTWPNRQDYILVSINYRLAPENRWPAQIIDCKSAIRFLRAHATQYCLDPNEIGVWGGSAGGHLAAMLGTAGGETRWDKGINLDQSSRVQAVCAWYPPCDFVTWNSQPGGFAGAPPMINVQPLIDAWLKFATTRHRYYRSSLDVPKCMHIRKWVGWRYLCNRTIFMTSEIVSLKRVSVEREPYCFIVVVDTQPVLRCTARRDAFRYAVLVRRALRRADLIRSPASRRLKPRVMPN